MQGERARDESLLREGVRAQVSEASSVATLRGLIKRLDMSSERMIHDMTHERPLDVVMLAKEIRENAVLAMGIVDKVRRIQSGLE